jgi:cytochrome c oxidase assembly protein subunit 11
MNQIEADKLAKNKRTLALLLGVVVLVMFGFGYGLVPLYNVMCRITGQNNIDAADEVKNSQIDKSRSITIEFDTNTHNLPWQFKAVQSSIKVHPGQMSQAMFEVRNDKNYAVSGQAIASYGPSFAAQYFKKIECFCFTRQTLAAGEKRQMPVMFVVDSALPKEVNTITLSYTFFEIEGNGGAAPKPAKISGLVGALNRI